MKYIFYCLALLCLCTSAIAQETNYKESQTHTQYMDSIMLHLDKNKWPSPNLYDRVYPFAKLDEYDADSTIIDLDYYLQAMSEIERSRIDINLNNDSFFNHHHLKTYTNYANSQKTLPVFGLHYSINYIDTNALLDGRIKTEAEMMYDGVGSSAYKSKTINMLAIGDGNKLYANTAYKLNTIYSAYSFASDMIISTIKISSEKFKKTWVFDVKNLNNEIKFDEVTKDVLTIEAFDGNIKLFTTKQNVHYKMNPNASRPPCTKLVQGIDGFESYQGMYETKPYKGDGEYMVFYGSTNGQCHTKLLDPIIISDAWDALDKRQIYYNNSALNWYQYNGNSEDIYHKHLTWTDNDQQTGTPHNLVADFNAKGYDVVIVNYNQSFHDLNAVQVVTYVTTMGLNIPIYNTVMMPSKIIDGGADYIQRNAQILVKIIKDVNNELKNVAPISDKKTVIIGPSMGGQITRYALRWMEMQQAIGKPNMDHNCRLWVSFDSPHHGANIPYGLQKTIETFAIKEGDQGALETVQSSFNAPAAMQMVISQIKHPQEQNEALNALGYGILHTSYYNEIASMGMPQNCRKVALINGRYTGGQFHTPGSKMFELNIYTGKHKNWLQLNNKTYYMNNIISDKSNTTKYRLLSYGLLVAYNETNNFAFNQLNYGGLDGCPGGLYDVQSEFYEPIIGSIQQNCNFLGMKGWKWRAGYGFISDATYNMSFIPSYSGLAIINKNMDWTTPIDINNLVCNNNTPFDAVFAPAENESHTFLSKANVAWITQEIEKGKKDNTCIARPCTTPIINPSVVCKNAITYFEMNFPTSVCLNLYNITYTASSNIALQGGIGYNMQFIASSGGNSWIKATIQNPCGADWIIEKSLFVIDNAAAPTIVESPVAGTPCLYSNITSNIAGLNYSWSLDNFATIVSTTSNSPIYSHKITQTIKLKVNSACGLLPIIAKTHNGVNISGCLFKKDEESNMINPTLNELIYAYPNPTSDSWQVLFSDFDNDKRAELKLYDINAAIVWQGNKTDFTTSNITVPAADLPKGIYLLRMVTDRQTHSIQLIKN
jgi:Secretion system C-terminal sorting domain